MSHAEEPRPKRGEVWWVAFTATIGGEVRKTRPAVIVSNDSANRFLNRVQVIPITSNVAKLFPSEAYVTIRGVRHKAVADQITTASKIRLGEKMGRLSQRDMVGIDHVIKIQLGLI